MQAYIHIYMHKCRMANISIYKLYIYMPSKSWTQSNPSLTWSFLARHLQNTVTNRTALVDDNEILRYIRDKLNNFPCTCTANSYVTRLFVPLMSTPTKHLRGQRHSTAHQNLSTTLHQPNIFRNLANLPCPKVNPALFPLLGHAQAQQELEQIGRLAAARLLV